MANAAAKKSAAQNEKAVRNLRVGMYISNALSIFLRWFRSRGIFSLPFGIVYSLLVLSYLLEISIYYFLVSSGTPTRDSKGTVRPASVDLANPGYVCEWLFDVLYITWTCQVGSALFSEYVWWLYVTIPGYILYKIGPMAYGFLKPGGGSLPEDVSAEPTSKRQQKLKARQERGDPRVRSMQVKR